MSRRTSASSRPADEISRSKNLNNGSLMFSAVRLSKVRLCKIRGKDSICWSYGKLEQRRKYIAVRDKQETYLLKSSYHHKLEPVPWIAKTQE